MILKRNFSALRMLWMVTAMTGPRVKSRAKWVSISH